MLPDAGGGDQEHVVGCTQAHWGHVPRYELANLQQGNHFVFTQLFDLITVFNLNISFFGEFLDHIENSDPCFLDRSHSYWKITIWWVKRKKEEETKLQNFKKKNLQFSLIWNVVE